MIFELPAQRCYVKTFMFTSIRKKHQTKQVWLSSRVSQKQKKQIWLSSRVSQKQKRALEARDSRKERTQITKKNMTFCCRILRLDSLGIRSMETHACLYKRRVDLDF